MAIERRRFLVGAAATIGAGAWKQARAAAPPGAVEHPVPPDPSKALGVPLPDEGYGLRSQFEKSMRTRYKTSTPYSSWTFTPLQDCVGIITPSGLHFERSHAGTAIIDPARHFLYVHGMVRDPRKYSMRDVKRLPAVSRPEKESRTEAEPAVGAYL